MNAELKHRLNYEILILENVRKEYASRLERLEDCRGAFLRRKNHGHGKYYYFIKRRGQKNISISETLISVRLRGFVKRDFLKRLSDVSTGISDL